MEASWGEGGGWALLPGPGAQGAQEEFVSGSALPRRRGWDREEYPGGSYQLSPVYDVLPAEMFTRKLLFKLLLGHLGHQEVGLVHQGCQHVRDAP